WSSDVCSSDLATIEQAEWGVNPRSRRPVEMAGRCGAAALDLPVASRHRPRIGADTAGWLMRHALTSLKTSLRAAGAVAAALAGLALALPAHAANPLELNFYLSGPRYDGALPPCEAALGTISA